MKDKYTREQYMSSECTHSQYYNQFFTDSFVEYIGATIGCEALLQSWDEHLNDIPLAKWDGIAIKLAGVFANALKLAGDFYSLAAGVCICKEAARQYIAAHVEEQILCAP